MYEKILLPVDLHEESTWRKSLPVAVDICRAFRAELHVLTIFPDIPVALSLLYMAENTEHQLAESAAKGLDEFVATHLPAEVQAVKHLETGSSVYHGILSVAERVGADLIVMASHRPETSDYLIGSNASRVVRHATKSVLVVR